MLSARDRMIRLYDRSMRSGEVRSYYEDSGFYNFGYWDSGATSQREASGALVDQLVARIAAKGGRILDVACGIGGSTQRLTQNYQPDLITGINISETQIAEARARAPDCIFRMMSATDLEFPTDHFDAVICVEAAFHFDTRDRFFREALRVLKPGGSLVLSDILFRVAPAALLESGHVPRDNLVPSTAGYRERLAAAGFVAIDLTDATDACLGGFRRQLGRWRGEGHRTGHMKWPRSVGAAVIGRFLAAYVGIICKTYLLASARKPAGA